MLKHTHHKSTKLIGFELKNVDSAIARLLHFISAEMICLALNRQWYDQRKLLNDASVEGNE